MGKGFTLIELMVSVTIFIVVMVISLGALLSISAAERKAESIKSVMNNLNFGLESMSRTIRTGINYHCDNVGTLTAPRDCDMTGATYFAFEAIPGSLPTCDSASTCLVAYCLDNGAIKRQVTTGSLSSSCSAGLPITASEVTITDLKFYVLGSTPGFQGESPSRQPRVVITITGEVSLGTTQTDFNLQTTVTQRLYDQ